MAFRNAYLWVIGLFLLTGLAFWGSYFSRLGEASWPYHVHGIVSTLWILLFVFQNIAINQKKRTLHRQVGISIMIIVPIFTAAGFMMVNTMTANLNSPFYDIFGDRLASVDIIGSFAFAWFCYGALARRRNRTLHGGYLLMSILLLLMPVMTRINPLAFLIPDAGMVDGFSFSFNVATGTQLVLAAVLYFRHRKYSAPFVEFAGFVMVQWICFHWINYVPGWSSLADGIASAPTALVGLVGLAPGILAVVLGWRAVENAAPSMPPLPA